MMSAPPVIVSDCGPRHLAQTHHKAAFGAAMYAITFGPKAVMRAFDGLVKNGILTQCERDSEVLHHSEFLFEQRFDNSPWWAEGDALLRRKGHDPYRNVVYETLSDDPDVLELLGRHEKAQHECWASILREWGEDRLAEVVDADAEAASRLAHVSTGGWAWSMLWVLERDGGER